jgi:alkanesulfonate monooxygenase SsuD/methylene tetrahydromethanopterin reductase-like flavin-dependent oxidoreductase (luciferase family)
VGAPPGRRTALLPDNYERYRQRFAAEAAFDYDDMQDRVILFGSPDHVAERVDRLRQAGADQLILFVNYGGIDSKKVMNSLELFASKVMPQFAD